MITMEQVEALRAKTGVSYEEAKEAMEAVGGDLLDAVIYLERQGKLKAPEGGSYSTRTGSSLLPQPTGQNAGPHADGGTNGGGGTAEGPNCESSFGREMKELWNSLCRLIHKGNLNHFEVTRHHRCVLSVPVNLLVLALLFFFWITLPLLVVGLFFSFRYHFRGPDLERDTINGMMDSAADTAENLKRSVMEDGNQNTRS